MRSGFLVPGAIGPVALGGSGELADPVPVSGTELLANGDFSAWTGDNPNGWSLVAAEDAGNYVTESPSGVARIVMDNTKFFGLQQQIAAISNHDWAQANITLASIAGRLQYQAQYTTQGATSLVNAQEYTFTYRRVSASVSDMLLYRATGYTCDAGIDNASVRKLTLSSLLSTRAYSSADCDLSAAITRTVGTQAGLVARLDSAASPANFIIAYLDGPGNVKVDTCKNGVYANVAGASGAVSYAAGRVLRLVVSGTSVSVYYNGTQVGTTQTITDAGIDGNKNHGKFSTYAANTFTDYVAA